MIRFAQTAFLASLLFGASTISASGEWYRGNTHVHTELCGHADSSPEFVAKWYHDRGYNFLVLSEHNKFIDPEDVKLPDNKRDDFILIPGQEITGKPVGIHTTAMNIDGLIPWENLETDSKTVVIQDQIDSTKKAGGQPILNHPHGGSAVTSQDILPVQDFHMMEVYNANTKRNNLFKRRYLNSPLTSESIWDDLLTAGMRVYGVGSDDAHTFMKIGPNESNAGMGWVMVRADSLDPDAITEAMERGDFYASNGICLKRYERSSKTYAVEVDEEKTREMLKTLPAWAGLEVKNGVEGYRIEFVGVGGKTLKTIRGSKGAFPIRKLDTYVRVRVVFTRKRKERGFEEFYAWGQPVFAVGRASLQAIFTSAARGRIACNSRNDAVAPLPVAGRLHRSEHRFINPLDAALQARMRRGRMEFNRG